MPSIHLRHPRLLAFGQLLHMMERLPPRSPSPWVDFLERLPLVLGQSAVDRVAPYSFADDIRQALGAGLSGLLDLLERRHDPALERERARALLPDESQRVVLWPRRFRPMTLSSEPALRALVEQALLGNADLDAGLLESWLSPNGGGRALFHAARGLLSRCLALAVAQPSASGIGLLGFFALRAALIGSKERLKSVNLRALPYARLERLVGTVLHALLSVASAEALTALPPLPQMGPESQDRAVLLASLGPGGFFSIRGNDLAGVNPFQLDADTEQILQPHYLSLLEQSREPEAMVGRLMALCTQESLAPVRRAAMRERFRRLALAHLMTAENTARDVDRFLGAALSDPNALLALIESPSHAATLLSGLPADPAASGPGAPDAATRALAGFLRAIAEEEALDDVPLIEPDILQELLELFVLRQLDAFAENQIHRVSGHLVDRRATQPVSQLVREYQEGQLYRFALDAQPLLSPRPALQEAQLFVDLKGYTRRTARVKEQVMADFLKGEFYEPILQAAKRYHLDPALRSGGRSLDLVNLLGDAVAFSGDIQCLVDLARDIQDIFRAYREKLRRMGALQADSAGAASARQAERRSLIESERSRLGKELESIEAELERRRALAAQQLVFQVQQDFREQYAGLKQQFDRLQRELAAERDPQRKQELRLSLERLRASHLGFRERHRQTLRELRSLPPAAQRERLLEMATRALSDRARAVREPLLKLERELRAIGENAAQEEDLLAGAGLDAGLYIAFGAASQVIRIEDDVWGVQRVAISERLNEAARGTARNEAVRAELERRMQEHRRRPGCESAEIPFRVWVLPVGASGSDLYNLGEALSADALRAYLEQTRLSHRFAVREVSPADLHPEIRARFYLPDENLRLVFGAPRGREAEARVFRLAGEVTFRGFEGWRPTRVYEILRPEGAFCRMLQQHHLVAWLQEWPDGPPPLDRI
jgi:hypothetical protein